MKPYLLCMLVQVTVLSIGGCGSTLMANKTELTENENVTALNVPSKGFLDANLQKVALKYNSSSLESIEQIMNSICADFRWFQPYTIMHLYEPNNANVRYIYYPAVKREKAFLFDAMTRIKIILPDHWCPR